MIKIAIYFCSCNTEVAYVLLQTNQLTWLLKTTQSHFL